jgi:cytidine deaminase
VTVPTETTTQPTPQTGTQGGAPATAVDWEALRASAREIQARAYVPYSHYPVGAAALVDDGRLVRGCNVENAGYGVTLCAECGLVSDLVAGGGGRLVAFACVGGDGRTVMPCGRCRQLLWEHGGASLLVDTPRGVVPMTEVLPQAFDAEDLEVVQHTQEENP